MTNEEVKGRLESFIDTFNICKEHDNALVAVSISKEDIQAFTQAIKALGQQPCEDCVSRQEVLDQAVDYGSNTYLIPVNSVKTLPPVTPKEKTATWVPTDEEPHEDYECNKCGYVVSTFTANIEPHTEYKYCPNCGARMVSK